MLRDSGWARGILAGTVLAAAAVAAQAAGLDAPFPTEVSLLRSPTTDAQSSTIQKQLPPVGLAGGLDRELLSAVAFGRSTEAVYNAPGLMPERAGAARGAATYATLVYPEVTGLVGGGGDERSVPITNMSNLMMGPGGVGRVMLGRPGTVIETWNRAGETAISYIRPHVNLQMMFALEAQGAPPQGDFEGPGVAGRAYLAVDHQTKVDSSELGTATQNFGNYRAPAPRDEPQTAVAAGLDLGLLPTFLSQMGVNVSIVASRGRDSGNVSLALVGTTELPVDWAPRGRDYQHMTAAGVPMEEGSAVARGYNSAGGLANSSVPGVAGAAQKALTQIAPEPITPEPLTLTLLAAGSAVVLIRRRLS
jgi:hypothetical protein